MPCASAAHRVFKVPELLRSICKYSCGHDLPDIAYVSRSFFRVAAPLIWEEVAGVHHLLVLIPGVEVKEERSAPALHTPSQLSLSMTVPSYSTEVADFTRFDQYAHFVKRLDILPSHRFAYRIHGWRELSEQAKRRVLLPNLLELNVGSYSTGTHDLFLWTRAFLSPSLTSIVVEVGPKYKYNVLPTIPSLVAKSLLGHIEATCRELQHLQIFPAAPPEHGARQEHSSFAVADFWERSFYERLGGFRLKALGCTTELLSPEWIHILGDLPLLESLDLYAVHGAIADIEPATLPSLKKLALHSISPGLFNAVDDLGLLAGLNSLYISFKDSVLRKNHSWQNSLVSPICRNSPELAMLELEFDYPSLYGPGLLSFRPMAALPLVDVRLKGSLDLDYDDLDQLATIWPMATRFELYHPGTRFCFNDLVYFTKLPRLRHLTLNLARRAGISFLDMPVSPSSTLQIFEISGDLAELNLYIPIVAKYLLLLWPDLQQVGWSEPDSTLQSSIDYQSRMVIATLDSLVTSQRDMNRLEARIIEEYG
ncbi:hypothetical protein FS749_014501, partial [Ceratobasidium sp. UAMH 11750]